jgi:hypothetical protein
LLTPKWEALAGKLKNTVKVAYVDTEAGPTPQQIGQISGTPTIKAFIPRRGSAKNEKQVVDYEQAREVSDFLRFAVQNMPNYVEVLETAAARSTFDAKAREWGLPRVYVFTSKAGGGTSSTLKALSAEYRRRALIGELRGSHRTDVAEQYAIHSYPALICLAAGNGEPVHRFEGKEPSFRRLDTFVGKCALRKAVLKKPTIKEEL